jgi:hypothetical protein
VVFQAVISQAAAVFLETSPKDSESVLARPWVVVDGDGSVLPLALKSGLRPQLMLRPRRLLLLRVSMWYLSQRWLRNEVFSRKYQQFQVEGELMRLFWGMLGSTRPTMPFKSNDTHNLFPLLFDTASLAHFSVLPSFLTLICFNFASMPRASD